MAAGAVIREQPLPPGDAPPRGIGRRHGRAAAERRDVGDKRADLVLVEERRASARLDPDSGERHVAGAEVEVGRERADAAQRRTLPLLSPRAEGRRDDAAPVRAVAGGAVSRVELVAELGERRRRRKARQHQSLLDRLRPRRSRKHNHERRSEQESPHDCPHDACVSVPTPFRRIATKKRKLPRTAAIARKCRRPQGGGSYSSVPRVSRKSVTAAAPASKATPPPAAVRAISQVRTPIPQRAEPALQLATATPKPITS